MILSLVQAGEEEQAIQVIEKDMYSKKQLDLVNSPKAYAVLYQLT
jgi:hypothetical protein